MKCCVDDRVIMSVRIEIDYGTSQDIYVVSLDNPINYYYFDDRFDDPIEDEIVKIQEEGPYEHVFENNDHFKSFLVI